MRETEFNYWEINFISCEGNKVWTIAMTPMEWEEWEVRSKIEMGGCGDDPAEILSIQETSNKDWGWDLT